MTSPRPLSPNPHTVLWPTPRVLVLSPQADVCACFEAAIDSLAIGGRRPAAWVGGAAALARREIDQRPADVYVFDLALGSALTELWRAARARPDRTPCAMTLLSTQPDRHAGDIARGLRGGAADVFTPPWLVPVIAGRIERLIAVAAPPPSADAGWQVLFHESPAPQIILDPATGQIRDANVAACAFYGYSLDEMRTLNVADLEVASQPSAVETVSGFRHRRADGSVRDVKLFTTLATLDGLPAVHQVIQDNTKRREALDHVQTQRSLVNALRSTANVLLTTFDRDRLFDGILAYVQANSGDACANIMLIDGDHATIVRAVGYGEVNPFDDTLYDIRSIANLQRMMFTHAPDLIADTHADPDWQATRAIGWIRAHLSAPIIVQGRVVGFLSLDSPKPNAYTPQDAEHVQAMADQAAIALHHLHLYEQSRDQASVLEARVRERTEALNDERTQMATILDSMSDGVLLVELTDALTLRIRYVNHALSHNMGYQPEQLAESPLAYFQPAHHTHESYLASLEYTLNSLRKNPVYSAETRLTRANGTLFDAAVTFTRVDGGDGLMRGIVVVIRDISRERALRDERSRFVAFASHEMRTPITNMKTRLYLLRRQPEKTVEHLSIMEGVVERMSKLVNDLLDVNRFERGTFELDRREAALDEVLHGVLEVQAPEIERAGLHLTVRLPREPLMMFIDAGRIAQAITAVLSNAIAYTPAGGQIHVSLSAMAAPERHAIAVLVITDSGIGIAPEYLGHIFEPFYRVPSTIAGAAVAGTGLGLTIVKEIIALHNGDVRAESTPGTGTTLTIRLPLLVPFSLQTEPSA